MRTINLFLTVLMCCVICGCSTDSASTDIRYLPVKLVGSEMWSIIDVTSGKLVYKDEFREQPSPVVNDIFVVKNGLGTYDYYSIDNVKTPINKIPFASAAVFYDDVTVAALPGEPLSIINRKCEVVATLDKSIKDCTSFLNGVAVYTDYATDKKGFIDKTGKIILKAKYENFFSRTDSVFTIMDENDSIRYVNINGASATRNASPQTKVFVFAEGDRQHNNVAYGLQDRDGNVILRPKYDGLIRLDDNRFIAYKGGTAGLIDGNDDILMDFRYKGMLPVGDLFLVSLDKDDCCFINSKGDEISEHFTEQFYNDFVGFNLFGEIYPSVDENSIAVSNYMDEVSAAQKLRSMFTTTACGWQDGTETLENYKSLLYGKAPSDYTDQIAIELRGGNLLVFSKRIASEKHSYIGSYRFNEGVQFNYDAKLVGVVEEGLDVSEYPAGTEERIAAEFDRQMRESEYTEVGEHQFQSPDGAYIDLGYQDGKMKIYYSFSIKMKTPAPRESR